MTFNEHWQQRIRGFIIAVFVMVVIWAVMFFLEPVAQFSSSVLYGAFGLLIIIAAFGLRSPRFRDYAMGVFLLAAVFLVMILWVGIQLLLTGDLMKP